VYQLRKEKTLTIENPIVLWRNRFNVTQDALARKSDLSRPQLSKIERGLHEHLPEKLIEVTGVSDATYQRYRMIKRKQLDLKNYELDPFISPKDFKFWRHTIAWDNFMQPSLSSFAAAICINVNYLQKFESGGSKQLPPAVIDALRECGVRIVVL
jgi:hypothetical protein